MGAFKEICIEMGWLELKMLPLETSVDKEFTSYLPLFSEEEELFTKSSFELKDLTEIPRA